MQFYEVADNAVGGTANLRCLRPVNQVINFTRMDVAKILIYDETLRERASIEYRVELHSVDVLADTHGLRRAVLAAG